MGRKKEPAGWEKQPGSPKEFNQLLEELHNKQGPDVFSDLGQALGWRPQQIPPGIINKAMTAVTEEGRIQLVSRKIFRLTGFLAALLFLVALIFLTRFETFSELTGNLRLEVGLFLLVASLAMGISALTVSLLVGEGLLEKRLW